MKPPPTDCPPIVDSHLDLAENVTLFGRDLTVTVAEMRAREKRSSSQATVSIPDLSAAGVAVVFATVTPGFLAADVGEDFEPQSALYRTSQEAEAQALKQIALYEDWEKHDLVRLVKTTVDLEDHLRLWVEDRKPGLVLLMESADSIVEVHDLKRWWQRGLRIIGLTYGNTKYGAGVASGSGHPQAGGLTPDGRLLLESMSELGFSWDISHLSDDGVWQGLDLGFPRVCASHANARALTPTIRHLSDDVIRAVAKRGGVIGLVLYNRFLEPRWKQDKSISVMLDVHLRLHMEHIAGLCGWEHVGIGSDLDGGFGLEESPVEIDTVADLYKVGEIVPVDVREAVLGGNWLNFLRASLPRT